MELHLRVPADHWCVTFKEFFQFVEDVRTAWLEGEILQRESNLNPLHECSCHGPNLYQVNECFVKPKTLVAGGMSYALWLHPEGLPCQVFISHAWAEGIFEFGNGVRSAWPGGHGLTNLYCCLLANPQNLDLEVFLNVDPLMNPFAQALQRASHILVIPNSKISIYSRLWCVYEAYLGTTMEKVCLMPATPHARRQGYSCAKVLLVPFILGLLTSLLWRYAVYPKYGPHGVLKVTFSCLAISIIAALWAMLPPQMERCMVFAKSLHAVGLFLATSVSLPWWEVPYDYESGSAAFLHYFIPCALFILNMMCLVHLEMQVLEFKQLAEQAQNLSCQTVQEAQCSNRFDEERIRRAISGFEDDVDITVRVLMLAGAYTPSLRRAYDAGEDIRGAGILNLTWKVSIGASLWCACGLDAATRFDLHGIARTPMWEHLSIVSVASCFLTAIAVPLWFRCSHHGPDWTRGTLHTWYLSSMAVVVLPYLVALCQGWRELTSMSLIQRMVNAPPRYPSLITCIFETFSPPFFALLTVISGFIASRALSCRYGPYGHVRRIVLRAGRTFTDRHAAPPDSSDTDSGSGTDSEESCRGCMAPSSASSTRSS